MQTGNNPPDGQIEQIMLEKIKFGLEEVMSGELRNSMKLVTDWNYFSDNVVRRLTYILIGNEVHEETHDECIKTYPATMWEELKKDFAPAWFQRRFPVRYSRDVKRVTIKQYHVCPHIDMPRDHFAHIRWLSGREEA